jgi:hypothetical protein
MNILQSDCRQSRRGGDQLDEVRLIRCEVDPHQLEQPEFGECREMQQKMRREHVKETRCTNEAETKKLQLFEVMQIRSTLNVDTAWIESLELWHLHE